MPVVMERRNTKKCETKGGIPKSTRTGATMIATRIYEAIETLIMPKKIHNIADSKSKGINRPPANSSKYVPITWLAPVAYKTFIINPTDAAKHARDVGGPRLAAEIAELGGHLEHIHLIGHSSGCWAVSEAIKILAKNTEADLHLTLLHQYHIDPYT